MAFVEPGKGRATVEYRGGGLVVTIPAKRNLFLLAFMALWLVGWSFGEVMVIQELLSGKPGDVSLFLIAWLGGWTAGGAFAIYSVLWNLIGKEIILLDATTLALKRQIPIFSRRKEYAVANISKLRIVEKASSWISRDESTDSFGRSGGTLAFDYGRSTHHFGIGLDAADAQYVADELCRFVRSLCK